MTPRQIYEYDFSKWVEKTRQEQNRVLNLIDEEIKIKDEEITQLRETKSLLQQLIDQAENNRHELDKVTISFERRMKNLTESQQEEVNKLQHELNNLQYELNKIQHAPAA